MPVIQRTVTIAANSINQNVIEGSQYEFARRRQVISMGMLASAAGLLANINAGGDVVAEQFPVDIGAPANAFPVIPDEFPFNDVMEAGDRLSIPCQNTTAGAIDLRIIVILTDI